jgi:hypothetical protein
MPQRLVLHDQSHGRPPAQALELEWQDGVPLTARKLIAERVRLEWQSQAAVRPAAAAGATRMHRLNPFRRDVSATAPAPETLEHATASALHGFARNAFFLVVDGRQVTGLDEMIPLRPISNVTFVRLVPLNGG